MKKGWQTKKLADLVEVQNGYAFSSKDYSESGHFLMRIGNVQNGYISTADPKFIKLPADGSLKRFVLSEDDILVSLTGNVGRVGVIQAEHLPAALNQRVARISIRKDSPATRELLLLFLCSDWFREELIGAGHGAAQQNVSTKDLVEIEIPVPPLAEQQRIVGLLDEAFEGIATAKANAEKNLQNARALFESHLQSVFTQRGPGWVEKTLEEVLTVQPQNGWSPPAANHAASGTPVLTLSSVTGFVFRPNKLKYTSAKTDPKARYWIQNGDLLITRSNTPELVGHVAIASGIEGPTIYPDLIMRMNPMPDRALTKFLYYQLRTPELRTEIMGRAQGANPTMKKISNGAVKTLAISVPPIATQQAIVAKLEALTEETQSLARLYERKLAALEELKKSLLHQAFTGEL